MRVSREQSRIIRLGAKETQANVSSFLVESACLRAEEALASQRRLVYTPKQWDAFVASLDGPGQRKPKLQALMNTPSVLERE